MLGGQEEPVTDTAVETVIQYLDIQHFTPGIMKLGKTDNFPFCRGDDFGKGEVMEDLHVRPVGIGDANIFDECDFFKDILGVIAFM